jgi:hypothetical protein
MDYKQFKQTYLWTFQDTDWSYWFQCVDLVKLILDKCYCLWKIGKLGNANQLPVSIPNLYESFRKVDGLDGIQSWDIIVRTVWAYWHVGIFDSFNSEGKVVVLEQNWSGISSGAKIPWNEIRLKAYKPDFYQCYLTNKEVKKPDFSFQLWLLNQILTHNSEKWHATTDEKLKDQLHRMSNEVRNVIETIKTL